MSASSTPSEIANGPSAMPAITPDGRYVAFESNASNLAWGDFDSASDVYIRDRVNRVATLVSGGGSGGSYAPSISSNGRYVAFHSFSAFGPNDTNGTSDIYVNDLHQADAHQLVSVSSSGVQGNGLSDHPVITPDGRYVAFRSFATNLVPNDTNNQPDIFVKDLQNGNLDRVSIASNGDQPDDFIERRISISSDGRYIAFESRARLVADDYNNDWDVFVRDRSAGTTTAVSLTPSGLTGDLGSYFPSMSPDGRFVAFHAWASNLVAGDANNQPDIFLRDRATGQTTLVSVTSWGGQSDNISDFPVVTPDGRYVAFRSFSTSFQAGGGSNAHIWVKDRMSGSLTRASVNSSGSEANGGSDRPVISGDGALVAFQTDATNLVPNDTQGHKDIVLRNLAAGQTTGITLMTNSPPSASVSVSPTSGDRSTSFQATAGGTDPDGDPITYRVLWGDGEESSGQTPSHSYNGTGTFSVRAVTCDQFSACSNPSNAVAVQVSFSNRDPVAELNVSPTQGDLRTTFSANTNGSFDPDRDSLTSSIDWGDGTVTDGSSGQHQYSQPGTYEITGTVTDPYGGSGGKSRTVRVCALSEADQCVGELPTLPNACDNPTTCAAADEVEGAKSEVLAVEPCQSAGPQCSQVEDAKDAVEELAPDAPLGVAKGAGSFTVVTANVNQESADDAGECHSNFDSKKCNEEPRERAFAKRVEALATKSSTTSADGMGGRLPDIIVLQEVRREDIFRKVGDENKGILPALNRRFQGLNWKIAVALGDDDSLESDPTTHRVKDDTAILYASKFISERTENQQEPNFIQTSYGSEKKCSVAGIDLDDDGLLDCDKPTWKNHAVASFTRLRPDGTKTDETIAVASVHFVPPSFLASDSVLQSLNPKTSREEIYKQWAEKVGEDLQSNEYFENMDGYVLAGDFNASRCDKEFEENNNKEGVDCEPNGKKQPWWKKLRDNMKKDKGPFIDNVFRVHGAYSDPSEKEEEQAELKNQYKDGELTREKRIDFIWVRGVTKVDDASHDLTCGAPQPSCQDLTERDRYSDHRLVWSVFHLWK